MWNFSLDKLTINGFKSIHELKDFELKNLNVIVGANGAGKSNLLSFFRICRFYFLVFDNQLSRGWVSEDPLVHLV